MAPLAVGGTAIGFVGIGGGCLAFECIAGQKYYPGSAPLGDLFRTVRDFAGAAGGITLLLGLALLQMSFFAREPSPGQPQSYGQGAWLRKFLSIYFFLTLGAVGWLFAEKIRPLVPDLPQMQKQPEPQGPSSSEPSRGGTPIAPLPERP